MNFTMNFPGLKDALKTKVEVTGEIVRLFVEMERKVHRCPKCQKRTRKVHDYRVQKIQHLKWFERQTQIFLESAVIFVIVESDSLRKIYL